MRYNSVMLFRHKFYTLSHYSTNSTKCKIILYILFVYILTLYIPVFRCNLIVINFSCLTYCTYYILVTHFTLFLLLLRSDLVNLTEFFKGSCSSVGNVHEVVRFLRWEPCCCFPEQDTQPLVTGCLYNLSVALDKN